MIVDVLKNAPLYAASNPRLAAALNYLQKTDCNTLEPGKVELDGDNLFVLVQECNSRPVAGAEFEAHRKYADIHFVCSGCERMGYMHIERLTVTKAFDEAKDCEMLQGEGDFVTLFPGMFAVVFPEDAHMPCLAVQEPAPLKKAVVKIRM